MAGLIDKVRQLIGLIWVAILILIIRFTIFTCLVLPITYFINGRIGIESSLVGFFFALIVYLFFLDKYTLLNWHKWLLWFVVDSFYGFSFGTFLPSIISFSFTLKEYIWLIIIGSFISAFCLGATISIIENATSTKNTGTDKIIKIPSSLSFVFLLGVVLLLFFGNMNTYSFSNLQRGIVIILSLILWLFGIWLGKKFGLFTRKLTLSGWAVLSDFKVLGISGIFFILGYILITLSYSGIYASIWKYNNYAFGGDGFPSTPHFFDFFYFSVVTISTVGYGDIVPCITLSKAIAISEVFLGVTWITLVLALTISRLSKRKN